MLIYDSSNFKEALGSKNMVVACFFMKTCPFCLDFVPKFQKYGNMSGIDMVLVDITDENSPLWNEYGIEYVPSVIIFRQGRSVLHMDARPGIGLKVSDLEGAIAKAMHSR